MWLQKVLQRPDGFYGVSFFEFEKNGLFMLALFKKINARTQKLNSQILLI